MIQLLPSKKIEIQPIGFVKRVTSDEDLKDKNVISKIIFKKELVKALDGIEDFSHIFVIYWLHKISNAEKTFLTVHPQGKAELPLLGIFATRAPNRPNSIGLTVVELVKHVGNILWVKGLDAFDNTPVLDIKPYDYYDVITNARVPKWLT